uniref:KEN domain-containing protein n=1 Tax=Acrobeloides nanus TaxID=290746 RepID=A0A914CPM0_9BILA
MTIYRNITANKKRSEDEQAKELLECYLYSNECKNDRYSSMDLISNMVRAEPDERRTAHNLKSHPMFWDADRKMKFVKAVRFVLDEEKKQNSKTIEDALESVASNVFIDWINEVEKIPNIGIDLANHIRTNNHLNMNKHYGDNSTKLTYLLKMIRNYKEHKNNKIKLGDGITIFTEQFPKLIIEVYKVMAKFKTNEELKEELEEFYLKD